MFNIFHKSNPSQQANTNSSNSNEDDQGGKHPILKGIGLAFLLLFAMLYMCSESSLHKIENHTKEALIITNSMLTGVNISVDKVETSLYGDGNNIYKVQINNPPGFSSPYAIFIDEIRFNSVYSADKQYPYMIIQSGFFKKTVINYEINDKNQTNLYKILDTMIAKLSPPLETGFTPLDVLKPGVQKTPLNYTGAKFFIREITLEKPVINLYKNNQLIKKLPLDNNIKLSYINVEQPLQYGNALLGGSLQFIDQVDKVIK
jgi:hypothetical protein